MSAPALSVVVVGHAMAREMPRTLRSLSPAMQRGIAADDYEIVLVDSGTRPRMAMGAWETYGARVRYHWHETLSVSPAAAANAGMRLARGGIVGLMIDGARLASPGLLSGALAAAAVHPRAVVATLGFHLGPDVQMRSIHAGYDQAREDALLAACRWTEDGYNLFDIAAFAGSSAGGWFQPITESNALFMTRAVWEALGWLDEGFAAPGGGLVNLDLYRRATDLPGSELSMLLGEGSFHQIHGGVATNALVSPFELFHDEYKRLRGGAFVPPARLGRAVGAASAPQARRWLELSRELAREGRRVPI